jgi:predicted HTH domain antitoxin
MESNAALGVLMQILIDIPEHYLLEESADSVANRFKLYTALMLFRSGKLSAGAGCELASVDRYTFLAACREHQIPTSYSPEELEADLAWLSENDSTLS